MKDTIEIIKSRRCVREYKEEQISDSDIKFLIDCAGYAPSGLNMQPWGFLVIQNKDVMKRLSEIGKKSMIPILEQFKDTSNAAADYLAFLKKESSDMFYDAPVLVIILGKKNAPTAVYDCAMAAQTMTLAAHYIGIGSCWIGGVQRALVDDKLMKELGAPDGYIIVAPLIFGYPKNKTEMPDRREPEVVWVR